MLASDEPETSLHPDLLPPLARLIAQASKRSQAVVVSHAPALVSALDADAECRQIVLEKHFGETVVGTARCQIGRGPRDDRAETGTESPAPNA